VGRVAVASDGAAATAGVGSYALGIADAGGGSFDPANYLLTYQAATLLVQPRALTLTALLQSKRYGELFNFAGTEFSAGGQGLANGDSIGSVELSSTAAAAVTGVGSYTISIAGATGGRFDPANYSITYQAGRFDVTPRPLTIAAQNLVHYVDDDPPIEFAAAASPGSLVNGDALKPLLTPVPAGVADAAPGTLFTLRPAGAQFTDESAAANYALTYLDGRLVVLPKPPSLKDIDGGSDSGGGTGLVVELTPEQVVFVKVAQARQVNLAGKLDAHQEPAAPVGGTPANAEADPAEVLAAVLRGETQRIRLDTLLRLPLISIDPVLLEMLRRAAGTR
jgi:hypothetical protein